MALVENKNLPIFFKEKEITKGQLDQLKDVLRDAINQLNDISSANTVSITTLNSIVLPAINIVTQSLAEFDQAKDDIAALLALSLVIQQTLTQIGTEVAYQAQVIALGGQLLQLLQAFNALQGVVTTTTASAVASATTLDGIVNTGTVRVKKAEATQDGDPETLTAAAVIRQTADRVDQDLTSNNANGPTFQKVTIIDKQLTKDNLTNYDGAVTHSDIADGTNPHNTTADNIGYDTPGFTGFLENDTDVQSSLQTLDTHDHDTDYVKLSQLGVNSDDEIGLVGVATLTEEGVVRPEQLPSYVDDIVKFETYAELPTTGSLAKIYVIYNDPTESLNTSYRWDGDDYFPFDEKHAQWGFISGDILEQTDIEDAVYTPLAEGLIVDETIGTAIQALDEELGKVIDGSTDIAFTDADITATFVATAISEVQDNVDAANDRIEDVEDGTTDITFESEGLSSVTVRQAIEEVQGNVETVSDALADVVDGTTDIDFTDEDITAVTIAGAISELRDELDTTEDNVSNIADGTTPIAIDASATDLTSTDLASLILEVYGQKGSADGFATLDSNSRIPAEQLPLDALEFKGTFGSAQSTTEGDLPSAGNNPGDIYLSDLNDFVSTVASATFQSGDKAIWDGAAWVRNAARDSVVSVNTKSGAVTLDKSDIGLGNVENIAQVTAVTATAPIVATEGTTPVISINAATDEAAGSMSATDKAKLDALDASTLDTDTTNFGGILSATQDTVQKALDVLDDITATTITYDPSTVSLTSTNVSAALDELSAVIDSNTTQIRVEQFKIISDDNEDDTFTYRNSNNIDIIGSYVGGWYVFTLELAGFYAGGNLVWVNINDDTTYFLSDTTNLEEGTPDVNNIVTTVRVSHGFVNSDEIDIVYYQGVNIAAAVINDGSVTFPKLDSTLQGQSTLVSESTAVSTANQLVRRDASGNFAANEITATIDGKFKTARAITLDGDVSGTANFDGSAGITITTVVADNSHSHLTTDITGLQDVIDNISAVTISTTAPASPSIADLWFNSTEGVLYIYYNDGDSNQWVAVTLGETIDAEDIAYENTASGLTATQVQAAIDELAGDLGEDNIIEEVQAEGTPLSITSKTVNVTRASLGAGTGDANVDFYTTSIVGSEGSSNWVEQTTGDWDGAYIATKTVTGILTTDEPIIDIDLSALTYLTYEAVQADYGLIFRVESSGANELKFYASAEPAKTLTINIQVVR